MPIPLNDIRSADLMLNHPPVEAAKFDPPATPPSVSVEGKQGGFIIYWSVVQGVDGYRIAVMSSPNLKTPDRGTFTVNSSTTTRFLYPVANITRYFAVQSFRGGSVSVWSSMVSATSTAGSFDSDTITSPLPSPGAPADDTGGENEYGYSGPQHDIWWYD